MQDISENMQNTNIVCKFVLTYAEFETRYEDKKKYADYEKKCTIIRMFAIETICRIWTCPILCEDWIFAKIYVKRVIQYAK